MQEWELTPEQIKDKLNNMIWSFSRVNSSSCLYSFYLHYIEENEEVDDAFSQYGKLIHTTLEKYLKGELDMFSVLKYYKKNYPKMVTCDFPYNKYTDLGESYYESGLEYFKNLNFDFDRYEILSVEKEVDFKVGRYSFHGYPDAVYKDKKNGEIILCDHKTSSFKYLKDGSISKTNAEHFQEFKRQEYLYCIPLIEQYGKVDWLTWNMVKDGREIKIPFSKEEFEEAQEWAINQIKTLEEEVLWLPDTSRSYFCSHICGCRNICLYH